LLKRSLRGFARKDFTENLENVILQSSLARFTLILTEQNTKLKEVLSGKLFTQSKRNV